MLSPSFKNLVLELPLLPSEEIYMTFHDGTISVEGSSYNKTFCGHPPTQGITQGFKYRFLYFGNPLYTNEIVLTNQTGLDYSLPHLEGANLFVLVV